MIVDLIAQAAPFAVIAFLLWDRRIERREHAAMTAELCQRLQAPELAVMAHDLQGRDVAMPQPPGFDDDEAHWESKEALADRL